MAKQNKKPSDELIKSVLDDLKNDSDEPSFNDNQRTSQGEDLGDAKSSSANSSNEKTTVLGGESASTSDPFENLQSTEGEDDSERTVLAGQRKKSQDPVEPKVSYGSSQKPDLKASAYEAQFMQAENLKIAQQRIVELEKDIERLRKENEVFISASEIAQQKLEDLSVKVSNLERSKYELKDQSEAELKIFRDGLQVKDNEILRLRTKVEELESRLGNDLKKIRVRERELENRLELSKMEKSALSRSKDETILDLKRRLDHLNSEIENYKDRVVDLNHKLELNHEQFGRTVRALRIALTNLEVNENTSSITIAPMKKAE